MAYSGCVKKFSVPGYIKRIDELVKATKKKENTSKANPGGFTIGPKIEQDSVKKEPEVEEPKKKKMRRK